MYPKTLSPRELADVIGVSESSVKRWVDADLIRATRTAGGHRRILMPEALRFIRSQGMRILRPELLGLPDLARLPAGAPAGELTGEMLLQALCDGEAARARGLIASAYFEGADLAGLCDGPIAEALKELGEMWLEDTRGIFVEHRATNICIEAVQQIRLLMPPPPREAPVAVGGGPEHDIYVLPNLMVAAVLADAGYVAVNLGPHTPNRTFVHATEVTLPHLVWIALTSDQTEPERQQVLRLMEELHRRGHDVVIGGRTAEAHRDAWPSSVTLLDTMTALVDYVAEKHAA